MDIGSIFIIVAIAIITLAYISKPLVEKRGYVVTDSDRRLSTLQAQRDQILTVLQELEMDHAMGKVEGGDYQSQRAAMVSRGAAVLKELDLLAGEAQPTAIDSDRREITSQQLEDHIEAAISQMRGKAGEIESNFCSQCGTELVSGDHFCSHCGAAIKVGEA
jgi:CHASE3 domain sensor protein